MRTAAECPPDGEFSNNTPTGDTGRVGRCLGETPGRHCPRAGRRSPRQTEDGGASCTELSRRDCG
eukprot:1465627-Alexandrium_andersonii.AAC.1